jgi:ribulose-phosphate 3-epimerase
MIQMPKLKQDRLYIAPSILSADLTCLGKQVAQVEQAGADWLHIDIMDGHFVPNLSFGPAIVKWLDKVVKVPQDVHLMVQEPQKFIEPFVKAGASALTIHAEARGNIRETLKQIKKAGLWCGLSIKPDTQAATLVPYLDLIDLILVMSVYPGFGGQEFLPQSPEQISQVAKLAKEHNILVEVDGGINRQTAKIAYNSGARALVAGAAIFGQTDIKKALTDIKNEVLAK